MILRLVADTLVVWALIYILLKLLRSNFRTVQILKGILIIVLIKVLSVWLGLNAFSYIMDIFLQWGVLAVIILFQPEIRGMLERIGKTSAFSFAMGLTREETIHMVDEIVDASEEMSRSKTGALITIQQVQQLTDYIQTGIQMDSVVSKELLGTIFQYGTPMHDGAVIIQGNKIACAAAYFPPTTRDLPSKYGARHRAAVGISEITDSITIIVSEETGNISVAVNGQLTQYPIEGLRRYLMNTLVPREEEDDKDNPIIKTAKSLGISVPRRNEKEESLSNKEDERIQPLSIVDLLNTEKEDEKNAEKRR
ncbi:MAG: diadenylate cyclase CdaA [Erysipelotrichaceae bacterium]|nr:diadenylate cyclase CdaA [Erysipelotrichaceae bacterium]